MPIFFALYIFWKVFQRGPIVPVKDADITTGKAIVDAQEKLWPEKKPRNFVERVWFWIA